MSSRSALVTGGSGFIGGHLVEDLVCDGWRVVVLDDLSTGSESHLSAVAGEFEFVRGDVRDPAAIARAIAGAEVVFHQAAVASVPRSVVEPVYTNAVNVEGTLRVLRAAAEAGVRRVVFAGSTAVYGDAPGLPKVEEMPAEPRSPYALQKYSGERYCQLFSELHALETVTLRYFNVYGPRQDPAGDYAAVIPRFIAACLGGQAPRVYGDGGQTRDFVYVGDVVRANRLAAEAPGASGSVCNVGSGIATSLLALLEEIGSATGKPVAPVHESARDGDVRHSHASLVRAGEILGYGPRVSLAEGLRLTIAHFEKEVGIS